MNGRNIVKYQGIRCELYEHYYTPDSPPCVKLISSGDIQKAKKLGFECAGFPDEWVRYLTQAEYESLTN